MERLAHDPNRQGSDFLRCSHNDWSGARARAAPHAGGYKDNLISLQCVNDPIGAFLGGLKCNIRTGAGAKPPCNFLIQLNFYGSKALLKGDGICINSNEVDRLKL